MPIEEDDPVVATYDVFISPSTTINPSTQPPATSDGAVQPDSISTPTQPKFYILQYPSHRPASKPYSSSRQQKPTSLRIKRHTGIVEVDVPLLTYDNYNDHLGQQYGKVMHDSRTIHPTTGHGLSGGFAQNQSVSTIDLSGESNTRDTTLSTQTLGGKVALPSDKDPVYMLATMSRESKQIHLRRLDAVIQMRPQLHHIDAADEAKRRVENAGKTTTKSEVFGPDGKVKLETKAIELKVKDSTKDDPKDRNLNWNAKLLRAIQNDPWVGYEWIEKGDETFREDLCGIKRTEAGVEDEAELERPQLRSMLDNDEWLNKMSSPGIELRTRLKGRDRERARRKRQERLRAAKTAGALTVQELEGSDTMPSEDEDDVPVVTGSTVQRPESPEIQIKQESASTVPAVAAATGQKRRGRPPKNKATETVSID